MIKNRERLTAYAALGVLALAFGWIEAMAVVYLREIHARQLSLQGASHLPNLQVALVSLPSHLVSLEMAREICTVVLLGAVAWLAGRCRADRAGAFLLAFGIWDLAYYGVLRFVTSWPDSLSTWDILFLIPLPWVAPVWAPMTIAALFVVAGSYLFWTSEWERRYRPTDIGVLTLSVVLTMAAFLFGSGSVTNNRIPERFPLWLFWFGVALGIGWFARVEGRAPTASGRRPPLGLRVQTILPQQTVPVTAAHIGDKAGEPVRGESASVIREYSAARRLLDDLMEEARQLGEELERIGQALSRHPGRLVVGPDPLLVDSSQWDIVPRHPLPSMDRLVALTDQIREAGAKVEELRERLILLGRADVIEQPYGFFH